jgi:glycosyltransferase involved in cell wall biosynthesis
MRILTVGNMYPPHHLGGYELAWRSWVSHARDRGHAVDVLTTTHRQARPDPGIPEDPSVARDLPWYWHEHRFPRLGPGAVLRLEREAHQVLAAHLDQEPDAVCWWAMGGMPLSLIEAARRHRVRAAFVLMDDWPVYGPKVDRWHRLMSRPGMSPIARRLGIPVLADLGAEGSWIFLSGNLRERVAAVGVAPEHATVVGRGPDPDRFPPAPPAAWSGKLLCVGRLEERKGPQVAVAALAELPGCRLELIGEGESKFRERLERLARELGVSDRVSFPQPGRGGIAAAYAEADAVLFPVQWDEPWGFVPLEAMAVGRPVVASGTGGSAEYLRDGENALVYSPRDDPAALARAVRRLEDDARLRDRIRSAGAETAARFSETGFNEAVTRAMEEAG